MGKPKIVVICGPTGSGKTAAAIDLAGDFGAEIVSADSMQVYRYMDIGSAKPTRREQAMVPHHLIDLIDPDQDFDAAKYAALAHKAIRSLHERAVLPFIVGGTGFYIKALINGMYEAGPADPEVRRQLREVAQTKGGEALHRRLKQCDPDTADQLHPNDTYRIIRALEVFESTGTALSVHRRRHRFFERSYQVLFIGLNMKREVLYDRIDRRVDEMLKEGLLEEVRGLLKMGYAEDLKSMCAIGYRHMIDYIRERASWDEMIRTMKRDTRRYAKRQLTWFQGLKDIVWCDPKNPADIRRSIDSFLK